MVPTLPVAHLREKLHSIQTSLRSQTVLQATESYFRVIAGPLLSNHHPLTELVRFELVVNVA